MKTSKDNFKNETESAIIFLEGFSEKHFSEVVTSEIDSVHDDNQVKELIKHKSDATNRGISKYAFLVAWQKYE